MLLGSGDREEVLARQVFIEELSHWGSGEDEKEVLKKVPIPGKVKVQSSVLDKTFDPSSRV